MVDTARAAVTEMNTLEKIQAYAKAKAERENAALQVPPVTAQHCAPTVPAMSRPGGQHPYAEKALQAELHAVRTAPQGERNHQLNTSAFNLGQLIPGGYLDRRRVQDELHAAGRAAGLDDKEMTGPHGHSGTINSGLTDGMATPRIISDLAPLPTLREFDPGPGKAFWDTRPTLAHIHAYARARRACPWAVLGVVLARVIVATGPALVLPPLVGADGSLNLFLALVGHSGAGKGTSERCAADALRIDGVDSANVGSGEGIAHLFARRTKTGVERHREAVLMQVAEIDTLAALGDRKGATLLPELRKAWSGEDLGFAYADPTKALKLDAHTYRLALVAGVQPAKAAWVLDDADAGTPQRFTWLPATDPQAPEVAPVCPAPLHWTPPRTWPPTDPFTGRNPIEVCQGARTLIDTSRLARLRGEGDALDGHALQNRLKLAAALSLLEGRTAVTEADWELAGVIAALSEHTRAGVLAVLARTASERNRGRAEAEADRAITVADRIFEDSVKRVSKTALRFLREHGQGAGLGAAELRRRVASRDRDYLDEALYRLTETGLIEANVAHSGGTKWTIAEQ